ncbi:MAG: helix-turn-helix domain-containing protein [Bacteroidota bacterium]
MPKDTTGIKHILGLKVRDLRLGLKLSFQELSQMTGLSISYLNEIEKGKKYPKGDKMIVLAEALGTNYDDLVSLRVPKKLEAVVNLLQSNFFKEFPLDAFGLEINKLVELISSAPEKFNAFITTVLQIARNYEMGQEHFFLAALRAYQELNDNYFEEIEEKASEFRSSHSDLQQLPVRAEKLAAILSNDYGIRMDRLSLSKITSLGHLRSFYKRKRKELSINRGLTPAQESFLVGREIGFQYMNKKSRPFETPPLLPSTFEESLHNQEASYFSAALLMPESEVVDDIKRFEQLPRWQPDFFAEMMEKYRATPEMLMQRLTNILPHHFQINNLFFFRFVGQATGDFELTKELHLSKFHNPHANELNEHYCRRWISLELIRRVTVEETGLISGIQISKYLNTSAQYLIISLAWPNVSDKRQGISVSIGFQIDQKLKRRLKMLDDPDIPVKTVHTTCERCTIMDCRERVAPPEVVRHDERAQEVRDALLALKESE